MDYSKDLDHWYETVFKLTTEAGELVKNAFGKKEGVQTKSSFSDLVTETDVKVEQLLRINIQKSFPGHKFIGEESISNGECCELTDDPTWIIDPVDGTMNFVHGFPFVAISVALAFQKEVILGIVYNPILNKLYHAIKGKGAFCNDKPIHVSGEKEIGKALIISETGSSKSTMVLNNIFKNYVTLTPKVHGTRSLGSAALNMCSVASGEADSYYEYGIHCWDMAAGKLIVEEAGGIVLDPNGSILNLLARRILCASSVELAKVISKELSHIDLQLD